MQHQKKSMAVIVALMLFLFVVSAHVQGSNSPLLRRGMEGQSVWELQQLLNDLGYNIKVDGNFGYETETIVKAFQKSFDLVDDGVVGEKTWSLLRQTNPFLTYTINRGDTLGGLARKFDTSVTAIKLANNLTTDRIVEGNQLLIPRSWMGGSDQEQSVEKVTYQIERGDTLSHLALRFNVSVQDIKRYNGLNSDTIVAGQTLEIPGRVESNAAGLQSGMVMWPAEGRISSPFGYRTHPIRGTRHFHSGIDIVVSRGTPIRAVAPGVVTTSKWFGGYGRTIVIDHGDGYTTMYAHNDQLLVRTGAFVVAGQVVALSGNTGVSTGPHLHFEIRINDEPVNPMEYLQ